MADNSTSRMGWSRRRRHIYAAGWPRHTLTLMMAAIAISYFGHTCSPSSNARESSHTADDTARKRRGHYFIRPPPLLAARHTHSCIACGRQALLPRRRLTTIEASMLRRFAAGSDTLSCVMMPRRFAAEGRRLRGFSNATAGLAITRCRYRASLCIFTRPPILFRFRLAGIQRAPFRPWHCRMLARLCHHA